jgi:hypothetical protein
MLANLILFQLTWMAAVGGAGSGLWWPGLLMLGLFGIWHLSTTRWLRADLILVAVAASGGFLVDSALLHAGVLSYATPIPFSSAAPIWIVVLWIAFALTLNHSMGFLRGRPWLAAAFGLAGGPLAYWVAVKVWNAASFGPSELQSLLVLGIVWAVLTPILMYLAVRMVPERDEGAAAGTMARV